MSWINNTALPPNNGKFLGGGGAFCLGRCILLPKSQHKDDNSPDPGYVIENMSLLISPSCLVSRPGGVFPLGLCGTICFSGGVWLGKHLAPFLLGGNGVVVKQETLLFRVCPPCPRGHWP